MKMIYFPTNEEYSSFMKNIYIIYIVWYYMRAKFIAGIKGTSYNISHTNYYSYTVSENSHDKVMMLLIMSHDVTAVNLNS